MSDGSVAWDGDVPAKVYIPAEDKCDGRKKFAAVDMPNNWDDYTVYINCN